MTKNPTPTTDELNHLAETARVITDSKKVVPVSQEPETVQNSTPHMGFLQQVKANSARKRAAKALRKESKKIMIPKTVQDSIPYQRVYPNSGIIEISDGMFTRAYRLGDVNYYNAKDEEQAQMFLKYADLLNSFDPSSRFQIVIHQQHINLADFEADAILNLCGDELDLLREDQNEILRNKIQEGRNELTQYKYLIVRLPAESYDAAVAAFSRLDVEIISNIKSIGGAGAEIMTSAQRLEVLHDIYNPAQIGLFGNQMEQNEKGELVFAKEKFSFDVMKLMGLTSKDMIGPNSLEFHSEYGKVGSVYFRALYLRIYPQTLQDSFLHELSEAECQMVTSMLYQPIEPTTAINMVRRDGVNINANMIKRQKKASKSGYSSQLIAPELQDRIEENMMLQDDLTNKGQKLFYQTFVICHFADTKEQLDEDTRAIQAIGRRRLMDIKPLSWQQENGLDSCLPLCNNKLSIKRTLITENAAAFMPFVNQELMDRNGGMYYGLNAVSHNLILINRRNGKNGNGIFLGAPGTGKSMSAKQEMILNFISSQDMIIVIDPEREYDRIAELLGGEVIRIAPGSSMHINPFDIEMGTDTKDDPITMKSDFMCSIFGTIFGDKYILTAGQKSIIDRCIKKLYEPYLRSFNHRTGQYDCSKIPTLKDFFTLLQQQDGYEAMQLADALELYAVGTQDLFSYQTNVEYKKRFVVFDIKDIGVNMKALGELIVLNTVWNQIVSGRDSGRNTWFYIDEIYLLFKNQLSAEFLRDLYKRARKYGGIPTGITQNVSDLLENDIARTMISNSEFVLMLSQSAMERAQLADLLNISPTQMESITNAAPGHGLIYDGQHIVPFINELPRDSIQYRYMTTKLSEVAEIEQENK